MYPSLGIPGLQRVRGRLVETVLSVSTLACEMQLGVLLALPLLDGALHGQRELHRERGHVGLDLVEVLLAEVLNGVSHRIGLEHRDPLEREKD